MVPSPRCARCGAGLQPGSRFCIACGAPGSASVSPPAAAAPADWLQNGFIAAAIVFLACAMMSYITWPLAGLPALGITSLVPAGGCTHVRTGSWAMYLCSAKVALLKLAGPLIISILIFIFRHPIARGISRLGEKLPPDWRFGLPALAAALFFTMSWAAAHAQTSGSSGLVPQKVFPALIGLFTFVVARFGPQIQQSLAGFFEWREGIPTFLRILAAIAIPIVVSFAITFEERVSQPALKEQTVTLIAMSTGYLALAPRRGDLTSRLFARRAG
jgi:hypothetical protein